MFWIDDITAVLEDKSIIHFYSDGKVEFFPTSEWKNQWLDFTFINQNNTLLKYGRA